MTPCEERGYKVGDKFKLIDPDEVEYELGLEWGCTMILVKDTGDLHCLFREPNKLTDYELHLAQVDPLKEEAHG